MEYLSTEFRRAVHPEHHHPPGIWWLLRVTPPLPRRLVFPPLRLLLGLSGKEETPARTPWWLLLLRLIAAAAVIVALADPLFGKGPQVAGTGPVVLFVDNGWTAAANWDAREAAIVDILRSARRRAAQCHRATADAGCQPMDAGEAKRIAQALQRNRGYPTASARYRQGGEVHATAADPVAERRDRGRQGTDSQR